MLQLSMIGPPVEPVVPAGRERLRQAVLAALGSALCGHGLDPEALGAAADAIVDELERTGKEPAVHAA